MIWALFAYVKGRRPAPNNAWAAKAGDGPLDVTGMKI
jgi:hypothetical protein